MSDESARLNIHAVLLKIVALLFGLLGVLTLWRFRRLVLSGQADALIPVLWAGVGSRLGGGRDCRDCHLREAAAPTSLTRRVCALCGIAFAILIPTGR